MWGFHEGMGWGWVFGGIWMLVWGVKQFTGEREASRSPGDTPLEIAQKRLARGEITLEEFDQIKIGLGMNGLEEAGAFQHVSRL